MASKTTLTNDHYYYINKFRKERQANGKYKYWVDENVSENGIDLHFEPNQHIGIDNIVYYCNDRFAKHGHKRLSKATISKNILYDGQEPKKAKVKKEKKEKLSPEALRELRIANLAIGRENAKAKRGPKKEKVKKGPQTKEEKRESALKGAKTRKANKLRKEEELKKNKMIQEEELRMLLSNFS